MKFPNGLLVSFEGISGCGKTFLVRQFREKLHDLPAIFINEIYDRSENGLGYRLFKLLSRSDNQFFIGGLPKTETFLLLAFKICDFESKIAKALNSKNLVIEDRSIDTVAVYQAIMLCKDQKDQLVETMCNIYNLASQWRKPPDITFLVEDDFDLCLQRAENRNQDRLISKYSDEEIEILRKASKLYQVQAKFHKKRIVVLDLRKFDNQDDILAKIKEVILAALFNKATN